MQAKKPKKKAWDTVGSPRRVVVNPSRHRDVRNWPVELMEQLPNPFQSSVSAQVKDQTAENKVVEWLNDTVQEPFKSPSVECQVRMTQVEALTSQATSGPNKLRIATALGCLYKLKSREKEFLVKIADHLGPAMFRNFDSIVEKTTEQFYQHGDPYFDEINAQTHLISSLQQQVAELQEKYDRVSMTLNQLRARPVISKIQEKRYQEPTVAQKRRSVMAAVRKEAAPEPIEQNTVEISVPRVVVAPVADEPRVWTIDDILEHFQQLNEQETTALIDALIQTHAMKRAPVVLAEAGSLLEESDRAEFLKEVKCTLTMEEQQDIAVVQTRVELDPRYHEFIKTLLRTLDLSVEDDEAVKEVAILNKIQSLIKSSNPEVVQVVREIDPEVEEKTCLEKTSKKKGGCKKKKQSVTAKAKPRMHSIVEICSVMQFVLLELMTTQDPEPESFRLLVKNHFIRSYGLKSLAMSNLLGFEKSMTKFASQNVRIQIYAWFLKPEYERLSNLAVAFFLRLVKAIVSNTTDLTQQWKDCIGDGSAHPKTISLPKAHDVVRHLALPISIHESGLQVDEFLFRVMEHWYKEAEAKIEEIKVKFSAIDADQSGKIDFDEFKAFMTKQVEDISEKELLRMYCSWSQTDDDIDQDAFIDYMLHN